MPCLRSCSLTASTLSLLQSRPSLAANPPSSKSRINTPVSSVRRTSLIPSCSDDSCLFRVIRMLAGLPLGVAVATGGLAEQRRSLRTVNCRVVQGRARVERAKLWGTLLMSTLFTCTQMGNVEEKIMGLIYIYIYIYTGQAFVSVVAMSCWWQRDFFHVLYLWWNKVFSAFSYITYYIFT